MNSDPHSQDPFSRPGTPPPIPQRPPFSPPYPEPSGMKYAAFGIRLLAYFIDVVIVFVLAWLVWQDDVIATSEYRFEARLSGSQNLIWLAYYLPFWLLLSTSPGKFICRIKIVNAEGKRINPVQAILRMLIYIILFIGAWFMISHPQRQALHDQVAKTYVVHI